MSHLEKIANELSDYDVEQEEKVHYANDLVKHSKNVLKALASGIDASTYILQTLEVAYLLSKDIPEFEEVKQSEPETSPPKNKIGNWAVIDHNKSEIAQPFWPMQRLGEEEILEEKFNIVEAFDNEADARTFAQNHNNLGANCAVINYDDSNKIIQYVAIFETNGELT